VTAIALVPLQAHLNDRDRLGAGHASPERAQDGMAASRSLVMLKESG
jgi:hypothetical protein